MSWARCCALNCTYWVSHDAVKDVSPPIVDPASAAKAERYAGSIMQSPHGCLACNQRLRVEEGRPDRDKGARCGREPRLPTPRSCAAQRAVGLRKDGAKVSPRETSSHIRACASYDTPSALATVPSAYGL